MRKALIPLLLVTASVIFCGCVEHTPETTTTSLPPAEGFELHEWGVLAGCPESDTYFITSRPKQILLVRQPVIYIHSENKEPFDIAVKFSNGKPTDTYPPATVAADEYGTMWAEWRNVQVVDECAVVRGTEAADFVPLEEIISTLNNVDAECLSVAGVRGRFLFYEGELEFENKIGVEYNFESGKVTFINNGDYPVYNLILSVSTEGEYIFSPRVYTATVPELLSGEGKTVDLVDETPGETVLEDDLTSLGFTSKEAGAFASLWTQSFFYPTNRAGFANLIYRVSEDEYNGMISLEVTPQPEKTIRTLYVLVDISAEGRISECTTDADCVPAQCCHPTSCVPKEDAPDCNGIGCTAVCEPGTMDCGQGRCVCINRECRVEWTEATI